MIGSNGDSTNVGPCRELTGNGKKLPLGLIAATFCRLALYRGKNPYAVLS